MRTKQMVMKKTLTLGAVFLTVGMISFASVDLLNHNASAETFESAQGISFTFNPTVKITITGGTGATSDGLTIDNLTPGDYKDSNIITVTAGSNSPLGYTLSSTVGSSTYNSTELRRNGTETANKFTNLTTNKASLSAFDPGYWGYSYSTNSGSTWISGDIVSGTSAGYNGLPIYTTASPIKLINSSTPSESSVQFKIGARATSSQLAGTYSNVVNFIGVAKVVTTTYTINYNANAGSDTITNMPTPNPLQGTDTTGNAAVQIPSNVPVRTGYMFKGWCTSQTSDDTCSSDVVQPGGLVALNPGTSSTTATVNKTIYAMWKSNLMMQNLDPSKCTTTATTVVDNRDGEKYLVQRLADGKCWMLDNLRLDLGNSTVLNNTTGDNTNASTTTLNYLKNGGGSTSDRYPTAKINNVPWTSSSQNYYSIPMTISTYKDQTTTSYGEGSGKIGVYYNYCAASAGNYCFGDGTSAGSPSGNATEDICPKGWRIPTGGSSGEYQALYTAYSSDATSFRNALSTPLSGHFGNGSAVYQGSGGFFWSSTYYDASAMYDLVVDSSDVHPAYALNRNAGMSVRCIIGT